MNHPPERIDTVLARLPQAVSLLNDCEAKLSDARLGSASDEAAIRHIIELHLVFARDTIEIVAELLSKQRVSHARILLRSLFEVALAILWASHQKDGWKRLVADSARRDLEWAEKAKSCPGLADASRSVLNDEHRQAWADRAKSLPNVRTMAEGCDEAVHWDLGLYSYFAIYGLFSKATHGDLSLLNEPLSVGTAQMLTGSAVQATLMLVMAVYKYAGWHVEPLLERTAKILGFGGEAEAGTDGRVTVRP